MLMPIMRQIMKNITFFWLVHTTPMTSQQVGLIVLISMSSGNKENHHKLRLSDSNSRSLCPSLSAKHDPADSTITNRPYRRGDCIKNSNQIHIGVFMEGFFATSNFSSVLISSLLPPLFFLLSHFYYPTPSRHLFLKNSILNHYRLDHYRFRRLSVANVTLE